MQCEIRTPGRRSRYRTSCGQEARNFVKRVREITKLAGPAALFSTSERRRTWERGEWRTGERGYLSLREYKGYLFLMYTSWFFPVCVGRIVRIRSHVSRAMARERLDPRHASVGLHMIVATIIVAYRSTRERNFKKRFLKKRNRL